MVRNEVLDSSTKSIGSDAVARDLPILIRSGICSGQIEGSRLPSDEQLMRLFAASRQNIRTAVSELTTAGLLQRKQRLGTTVHRRKLPINLGGRWPAGVSDLLASIDLHVSPGSADTLGAPQFIADMFGCSVGTTVCRRTRILRRDASIVGEAVMYRPVKYDHEDALPVQADTVLNTSISVSGTQASDGVAKVLGLAAGVALFEIECVARSQAGEMVEYALVRVRQDQVYLVFQPRGDT